jgi:hypothetical protein
MKQAIVKNISGKSFMWTFDDSNTVGDFYSHMQKLYSGNIQIYMNVGTKTYNENDKDVKLTDENHFRNDCTIVIAIRLFGGYLII